MKPYLREKIPSGFDEIPDTTSYEAGYLVTKNAGWRNVRPVIDTVCKRICRVGAIRMEAEK